jgi:cellulose synthase (UDP-forming)
MKIDPVRVSPRGSQSGTTRCSAAAAAGPPRTVRRLASRSEFLEDVMSRRQRRNFRLLVIAWTAGLAVFYLWWFRWEHVAGVFPYVANTLLVTWTLVTPGYFLFFVSRMTRTHPGGQVPDDWRVAMVTTRAPSEPFAVVRETLEAMLAQDYPHDTWLADEAPTDEVVRWCAEHGVQISTRQGIAAYHRPSWPRRARCKEGNLAYFYDHYGYDRYDFVVQLDADHEPGTGYLQAMLRPFLDPAVGYVSAPSVCSKNSESSWSARGRLYSEAIMHGALQAGYTNGFAPLCIGSHYALRTEALREIGGLGPELAEDHSTTLMMNGHGWRGVHAFDAVAYGEGPPTLGDCITQEFQWSRSLMVVLLTVMPKYWSRLSWRLRLQFLFSQVWYALFGGTMLFGLSLPVIAVLSRRPLVSVSYLAFLLHTAPLGCLTLAILAFLKRHGWLRPRNAPIFSWEVALFQVIRWPWAVYGSLTGVITAFRPRQVDFRVTPKGTRHARALQWRILLPYMTVVVVSFLPSLWTADAGAANGYYFFLIVSQLVYVTALLSIVWIHRYEVTKRNRRTLHRAGHAHLLPGGAARHHDHRQRGQCPAGHPAIGAGHGRTRGEPARKRA